jgi:hypothetical protein
VLGDSGVSGSGVGSGVAGVKEPGILVESTTVEDFPGL